MAGRNRRPRWQEDLSRLGDDMARMGDDLMGRHTCWSCGDDRRRCGCDNGSRKRGTYGEQDDYGQNDYSQSYFARGRLTRDREQGVFTGVCAGLADHFGLETGLVRFAFILGAVFALPVTLLVYIVLALALPVRQRPATRSADEEEYETISRSMRHRPEATLSNLRYAYQDMELRLQDMERLLTSNEWKVRRGFRDIENGTS